MDLVFLKQTFYITYALLISTTVITFIEALRTSNPLVRHILNLETCISVVAGFFYSQFILMMEKPNISYDDINKTRYVDWMITTTIMLLVLCLFLSYHNKRPVQFVLFGIIILLNITMLLLGYLGEINKLPKKQALLYSFTAFFALFGFIWYFFVRNSKDIANHIMFWFYGIIWSFYGVAYMFDGVTKNITYNILDLIAKCFVGLFIWVYYAKILVV